MICYIDYFYCPTGYLLDWNNFIVEWHYFLGIYLEWWGIMSRLRISLYNCITILRKPFKKNPIFYRKHLQNHISENTNSQNITIPRVPFLRTYYINGANIGISHLSVLFPTDAFVNFARYLTKVASNNKYDKYKSYYWHSQPWFTNKTRIYTNKVVHTSSYNLKLFRWLLTLLSTFEHIAEVILPIRFN